MNDVVGIVMSQGVSLFGDVIYIYPWLTPVATATKFEKKSSYNSACIIDISEIFAFAFRDK